MNNIYYIEYTNIDRLEASDPVLVNGFEIGTVIDINLKESDFKTIVVEIELNKGLKLPETALAKIVTTSLTGEKAIVMDFPEPCTDDCLPSGSYLRGRTVGFVESMVGTDDLEGSVKDLSGGIGDLLDSISFRLTDVNNPNAIGEVFLAIDATTRNLKQATNSMRLMIQANQQNVQFTMENLSAVSNTIKEQSESIEKLLENAAGFSEKLNALALDSTLDQTKKTMLAGEMSLNQLSVTLDSTTQSLNQLTVLLSGINQGKGTAGKLIKDEALYENLSTASKNLEILLEDLRNNPGNYVQFNLIGGKK